MNCGHVEHATRLVSVDLSVPHQYHDLPVVPEHLHVAFEMFVWEWARYTGVGHCCGNDVVSETIATLAIWETAETIMCAQVCSTAAHGQVMVDVGAQLGWYSLIAAHQGLRVRAVDCDPDCVATLVRSFVRNGWQVEPVLRFVDARLLDGPDRLLHDGEHARFVKIDIEGAEDVAITDLWPALTDGRVDHLLVEVSPCFDDGYPALVARLIDTGYVAYQMPPKRQPPHVLDAPVWLEPWRMDRATVEATVASWAQENVWFRREDATW